MVAQDQLGLLQEMVSGSAPLPGAAAVEASQVGYCRWGVTGGGVTGEPTQLTGSGCWKQ